MNAIANLTFGIKLGQPSKISLYNPLEGRKIGCFVIAKGWEDVHMNRTQIVQAGRTQIVQAGRTQIVQVT